MKLHFCTAAGATSAKGLVSTIKVENAFDVTPEF
jgi:hypothetical protein